MPSWTPSRPEDPVHTDATGSPPPQPESSGSHEEPASLRSPLAWAAEGRQLTGKLVRWHWGHKEASEKNSWVGFLKTRWWLDYSGTHALAVKPTKKSQKGGSIKLPVGYKIGMFSFLITKSACFDWSHSTENERSFPPHKISLPCFHMCCVKTEPLEGNSASFFIS